MQAIRHGPSGLIITTETKVVVVDVFEINIKYKFTVVTAVILALNCRKWQKQNKPVMTIREM